MKGHMNEEMDCFGQSHVFFLHPEFFPKRELFFPLTKPQVETVSSAFQSTGKPGVFQQEESLTQNTWTSISVQGTSEY